MEQGSLTAVVVRLILLTVGGALEPQVGTVPHLLCMPEPLVNCRGLGLARSPRSQGRLISQGALGVSPVEEPGPLPLPVLALTP
jgi:hypothetical protein